MFFFLIQFKEEGVFHLQGKWYQNINIIIIIATGLFTLTVVPGTVLISLYIIASKPHNITLQGVYFYSVLHIRMQWHWSIIIQHHTESIRARIRSYCCINGVSDSGSLSPPINLWKLVFDLTGDVFSEANIYLCPPLYASRNFQCCFSEFILCLY